MNILPRDAADEVEAARGWILPGEPSVAARDAAVRRLLDDEGGPTNKFAVALWRAELPSDTELQLLDELYAGGWRLEVQTPLLDGPPAFVRFDPATAPEDSRRTGRFRLRRASERRDRPPLVWTVTETFPEYGVGQIIGPSYEGKTYVALGLALSLCNSTVRDWFGHRINRHGRVVYVLMEGAWDAQRRIEAWVAGHPGTSDERLLTVEEEPLNLSSAADVNALADRLREVDPVAVFIDTQALATPGADENGNTDMGLVFGYLKALARDLNCLVTTVHHTGHTNQDRARGASAQFAATDFSLTVNRGTVRATKVKAYRPWDRARPFRFVEAPAFPGESAPAVFVGPVEPAAPVEPAGEAPARGPAPAAVAQVEAALAGGPLATNRLVEACGLGRETVKAGCEWLLAEDRVRVVDGPNRSKIWSLVR